MIKCDNKTLMSKNCIDEGFLYMHQLFHNDVILSKDLINILYDVNLTQLEYNRLICSIPRRWKSNMTENRIFFK